MKHGIKALRERLCEKESHLNNALSTDKLNALEVEIEEIKEALILLEFYNDATKPDTEETKVLDVLLGMQAIGGIPTPESFYTEFDMRVRGALGLPILAKEEDCVTKPILKPGERAITIGVCCYSTNDFINHPKDSQYQYVMLLRVCDIRGRYFNKIETTLGYHKLENRLGLDLYNRAIKRIRI